MTSKDWSDNLISSDVFEQQEILSNAQEVGLYFQETRRKMGHTVEDVAKQLHMQSIYIEAIEKGNLDILPGYAYRIGFIKNYAQFLRIDPVIVLEQLDLNPNPTRSAEQTTLAMGDRSLPTRGVLVFSIFITLTMGLGYVFWQRFSQPVIDPAVTDNDFKELITAIETKGAVEQMTRAENPLLTFAKPAFAAATAEMDGTPTQEPAPPTMPTGIVLKAKTKTWIEIRKQNPSGDSTVVMTRVLAAGEEYTLPQEDGLMLKTGNAGGTEVYIDGKNMGTFGSEGQVKRKIPLGAQEIVKYVVAPGETPTPPLHKEHPQDELEAPLPQPITPVIEPTEEE